MSSRSWKRGKGSVPQVLPARRGRDRTAQTAHRAVMSPDGVRTVAEAKGCRGRHPPSPVSRKAAFLPQSPAGSPVHAVGLYPSRSFQELYLLEIQKDEGIFLTHRHLQLF